MGRCLRFCLLGSKGACRGGAGLLNSPLMPGDDRRRQMWAYYDRRVAPRGPGPQNVLHYFRGLGVAADLNEINSELSAVARCLGQLAATTFLDLGAGPDGTFTMQSAGRGIAIDQSEAALLQLHAVAPGLPIVRGDVMRLPVRDKAVGRVFISHLYGLLLPDERAALLTEAWRAGREVVVLDSGRPPGAEPEAWQTRSLPDGASYRIYRRHLNAEELALEVGGFVVFGGKYFVMTITTASD